MPHPGAWTFTGCLLLTCQLGKTSLPPSPVAEALGVRVSGQAGKKTKQNLLPTHKTCLQK